MFASLVFRDSVGTIISVLHIDAEVVRFETRYYVLKSVTVAPRNAHHVTLYRSLHLALCILYEFHYLFGLLLRDAFLHGYALANSSTCGRLNFTVAHGLQRHA